jgi:hypothetical protein
VGAQEPPRAAPPDPWRSLRSARVPPMHYLDKPRRPSIGPIGWVRIQSATRTKLGQISTGVDNATVRCAIYTRKSSEEGLDQEFNSLLMTTAVSPARQWIGRPCNGCSPILRRVGSTS